MVFGSDRSLNGAATGSRIVKSFLVRIEHDFALNFIAGNIIPVQRALDQPKHGRIPNCVSHPFK